MTLTVRLCGWASQVAQCARTVAYFQFYYFNCQGWDHIYARIIADAIVLATKGLYLAAKEAITETIRYTQTARGEPRL